MIQSPIVGTGVTTSLGADFPRSETIMFTSGITSFFSGDVIRVGSATTHEMMKIIAVNNAGITSAIRVHRNWMGTDLIAHSNHDIVEKMSGNYNIVDSTLNFAAAPIGNRPKIGVSTSPPNERDFVGITTTSSFSGRIFNRSGIKGGSTKAYAANYNIDDISQQFDGQTKEFTLKVNKSNVTGIATNLGIVMVNGILQGAGALNDYALSEVSGITSITFTGTASSIANDVNNASVPVGGIIVSVASSEGFGYQPLVSAGATVEFTSDGKVKSVSIGNSGSGYRVRPGNVGMGSTASIGGVGIATVVRVGVSATTSTGTPNIQFIGTAAVTNGRVVSIAVTNTGVIPGFPGAGQSAFNLSLIHI